MMPATTCARCGAALNLSDEFCTACGEAVPAAEPVVATPADPMSPPAAGPGTISDPAELEELRAATLGHYDVKGELGRGGMATVYLAHEVALDRKVAIKVMSAALAVGDGIERFKREARTAASLSHPNIIPIYAVQHTDRLLYFVMKYVEGRPLDTIIRELGTLPIPMVQAILGQVASAFGYAHRRGVVHRDIKPGNILIDDEGWAVVTDFGIAKVAEGEQLTQTGLAVGTPTYMSPEQVMAQPVTGASDQYSLGIVAYEMLTGKPPFHGGGTMAMMYAHVHHAPAPIERPDCPDPLRDAVMRMLAKNPADRWPSIEDAISAIGAPPLTYDDPTRSQLIALAKTGAQERLSGVPRTPRSPIPLMRTPAPRSEKTTGAAPAPAAEPAAPRPSVAVRMRRQSRVSIALAVGGLAVAAVSLLVVTRSRSAGVPPALADTTATAAVAVPAPGPNVLPKGLTAEDTLPAPTPTTAAARAKAAAPAKARPAASVHASAAPAESTSAAPPPTPAAPEAVAPAPAAPPAPTPASRAPREPSGATALLGASAPSVLAEAAAAERHDVERAIRAYGAALERGSVDDAHRLFPAMPEDHRSYLGNLFGAGGRVQTRWKISDINVRGDTAVAQVRGTTRSVPANGAPSDEAVNARVTLRRVGGSWQLQSF
jgi:serine/threonine protein kinase